MAETYCEDCDHVESGSRKMQPYRWLCRKKPIPVKPGYVVPGVVVDGEPFKRCKDVNKSGDCEMFEPMKDSRNE